MTAHTHIFPAWPFPCPVTTAAFCTAGVVHDGLPVLQVSHDTEGDWQFLDATTDEPSECVMLCLGCVLERDATLSEISDLPPGWSAFRPEPGARWERWEQAVDEGTCEQESHDSCDSAAGDAKALANIEQYGLHILSIQGEGDMPPFAYSIGIEQSLGLPELIIIGLSGTLGGSVINECYRRMKAGEDIKPGIYLEGLLGGGFKCLIGEVAPEFHREYMGWAVWLYKDAGFRAWQIIFPSTLGPFPWEPEASEGFRRLQPLLHGGAKAAHLL